MNGFHYMELPPGEVLFCENEPAESAFLIESGSFEISVRRNDEKIVVAKIGPGEILGELAVLIGGRRSATVTALEKSVIQKIDAEQFRNRVMDLDPVMRMLIETVMKRLNKTLQKMDRASEAACNVYDVGSNFASEALASLKLENDIALALKRGELRVHYQPIVHLETGMLCGFEGLVRWQHPERGLLAPDEFIPTASESMLIRQITSFCLNQVCADLPRLRTACLRNVGHVSPVVINLNITGRDLEGGLFVEQLSEALKTNGIPGKALTVEITESSLMLDTDMAVRVLKDIKALGTGIAIDDFGTGYSSMSHLVRLPASLLKIDRSFVAGLFTNDQSRKIVVMLLQLAQQLGMNTVSEGIETPEDYAFLAKNGSRFGQGYLFSRPVALNDAIALITSWDASFASQGGVASDRQVA
ncbi:MAG: EAL domain-containing protein [Pseudomonadota bacterium]